jgi:hypothetical protein
MAARMSAAAYCGVQQRSPAPTGAESPATHGGPAPPALSAQRGPALAELQAQYRERAERWGRRERRLERARIATFLAALCCFFAPFWLPIPVAVALVLAGACAVSFVAASVLHERLRERERRLAVLRTVARETEARRLYRWEDFPVPEAEAPAASHPYGADLDLFGPRSLFHLIYTAGTPLGLETLKRWMLELPGREEILARQAAVRELSCLLELRLKLAASARPSSRLGPAQAAAIVEWAEAAPWVLRRRWLVWASRAVPALTFLLAALQVAGATTAAWWLVPAFGGFILAGLTWRRISPIVRGAELRALAVSCLADAFQLIADAALNAPLLREIHARLADGGGAARQARRLARLVQLGEIRYSGMLHGLLHGLLLWDVHVAYGLERWRQASGSSVREWYAALGRAEALCCLAECADAHPGWAYPALRDAGEPRIVATGLAHPLLSPDRAVGNDVRLDPGRVLLVTGSNMSGKSTLLRAIGVNVVLARLGAPVCAGGMEVTTSGLYTYFHVTDSLLDGVSTFLAGLRRLKGLVDEATRVAGSGGTLIFLLDEPLQGTNPPERQTAIRRAVRCLLRANVTGAVASHDLSLMEPDDLGRAAVPVHFSERLQPGAQGPGLIFDYKLRPGLCTSTNALRLLEALGFPNAGQ